MWWTLLVSCEIPPSRAEATADRDAYFSAWCRLYANDDCVDSHEATCDWTRDYGTRNECTEWLRFSTSDCDGINELFDGLQDEVADCIARLQDFECGVDDFCVDGEPAFEVDTCKAISDAMHETCPTDSW